MSHLWRGFSGGCKVVHGTGEGQEDVGLSCGGVPQELWNLDGAVELSCLKVKAFFILHPLVIGWRLFPRGGQSFPGVSVSGRGRFSREGCRCTTSAACPQSSPGWVHPPSCKGDRAGHQSPYGCWLPQDTACSGEHPLHLNTPFLSERAPTLPSPSKPGKLE